MTPERLKEILDDFRLDRATAHQEFCIESDHCDCYESSDRDCAEIQDEIERLTRELTESAIAMNAENDRHSDRIKELEMELAQMTSMRDQNHTAWKVLKAEWERLPKNTA